MTLVGHLGARSWQVPTLTALREKPGGGIYVYGSLSLVRSMLVAGLVDESVVMIEPVTLGGGKRLFPDDGQRRDFTLITATTTTTGVQVCRYRAGP